MVYADGSPDPVVLVAPEKKIAETGGGKGRPSEGKMFPRGTGK